MDKKNIKQLINENFNKLSPTHKKVGRFVVDNYQESMLLSSTELASAANVSNAAVIRFAKALGFTGFIEYKNQLKKEYSSKQKSYYYSQGLKNKKYNEYISDYFSSIQNDIGNFIKFFDIQKIDDFCDAISHCRTLYLMGIGSDSVIVSFLQNYLNIMGVNCVPVYEEGLTLREKLFHINSEDVFLLTAYPTTLSDEYWASNYAKEQGARVLILTSSELTAKQLQADNFAIAIEHYDSFFNSYIVPMLFCNVLLLRYSELNVDQCQEALLHYDTMLENNE
ncbi:MAG: MurR/RpiR family transcriptional regulator [Anaerovoracaceae bacterium]